ncbi:DUF4386 domain-containing protein [Gordonia rhizosphera]|uniref:DUF4386 domain-containing protein n=1 Tax=Gordonia rhizosphera NBRC 16068 TaxID=1108045 RepID=K6WLN9_9ACTN|nr:DUF4386 domain-containing protein [Gordonia rhizosphera]GAB93077.1 hypothetical protein GORHZ_205_00190 [Gordonia rhizosphera NBRC 16068]
MTSQKTTARATGAWYLGLGITGMVGFLLIRPAIWVDDDAAATLANLTEKEGLARLGLALEMAIVVTQALAAIWFYKLYRSVNHVAGVAVAAFGLVNAVAIMASAVFMASALAVAGDSSLAPAGDAAATVGLLHQLSTAAWGIGALFFGLWLIPMGWAAITSGRFPAVLGWILVAGGAGYVLSSFVDYGLVGAPSLLVDLLAFPATIGEFWMIGYLLTLGIRSASATAPTSRAATSASS